MYIYIYTYICIYTCVYLYIYIYIYTHNSNNYDIYCYRVGLSNVSVTSHDQVSFDI